MVLCGIVPLAIGLLGLLNRPAWREFFAGLALTGLFLVTAYWRSMAFESRHLDAPRSFWRDREALVPPRFFHAAAAFGAIGTVIGAIALASGSGPLAALLIAPVSLAWMIVALMWGKVS